MSEKKHPYFITICSGKGGVGKSVLTTNLAYSLAISGIKTLIWDADMQFPNQHLIVGVEPPVRLSQVYAGNVDAKTAIFNIEEDLDILSDMPASGLAEYYSETPILDVYRQILQIPDYEVVIIDSPAGASSNVLQCCDIADNIALVVTDEPTSLLDAYGLVKILLKRDYKKKINLIVNNVIDFEDADEISEKMNLATHKFLKTELEVLGFVPYDRSVRQSIINQEPIVKNNLSQEVKSSIISIKDQLIKKLDLIYSE
jgi:flagellar biosynthesis protein FlhG